MTTQEVTDTVSNETGVVSPSTHDFTSNKPDSSIVTGSEINESKARESIGIEIFTKDGQRLIYPETIPQGRKQKSLHLPALLSVDPKISKLMLASKKDDPFADQTLYTIESEVNRLKNQVNSQKESIVNSINAAFEANGAKLNINKDSYLEKINIELNNALTTEILWLVIACDRMFFAVYMALKHGIMGAKTAKAYQSEVKTLFRNILRMASHWKHTGITRADIAHKTEAAVEAYEKNQRVHLQADILLLEERAVCAPVIIGRYNKGLTEEEDSKLKAMLSISESEKQSESQVEEREAS